MKPFFHAVVPVAVAALVLVAGPGLAHSTSSIQGIVTDSKSGQPLMSVSISAYHAGSHVYAGSARSARDGSFRIRGLASGDYQLFATKSGYRAVEVSGLNVVPNDHLILGFSVPLERALVT